MSREHFAGVVHRDKNDVLWFAETPVPRPENLPRNKSWAGTLWYSDATVRPNDVARLLGPEDEAYGPSPGSIRGAKIRTRTKGIYRIVAGDSWGVHRTNPETTAREIRELRTLAVAAGMNVKTSAATTAITAYLDRWDGDLDHPSVCQLPCQWRAIAHAAFHGGPIAVLRGGADHATQIDVRRAYLDALYTPVPVLGITPGGKTGGYRTLDDPRWEVVRRQEGFVDATVYVHVDPSSLPPLPVHAAEGVLYPNGRFRGSWTIAQVREAELRGEVVIEAVHQVAVARELRPLFAEIADFFATLPDPLAKITYQRFWARWGNKGGWTGVVSPTPRVGEIPGNGLWWSYDGVDLLSPKAPRIYRPDLAAFIASLNHRRVMDVIHRDLTIGSVVAVHVDAVWTTDHEGAAKVCDRNRRIGGWRVKREGPLRFWSPGCYDHAGDVAASGYDASVYGSPTHERVDDWMKNVQTTQRKLTLLQREWTGNPTSDAHATSRALDVHTDTDQPVTEGPLISDPIWSRGGWVRPGVRTEIPSWAQEQGVPPAPDPDPSD